MTIYDKKRKRDISIPNDRIESVSFVEEKRSMVTMNMRLDNSDGLFWTYESMLFKGARLRLTFGYPGLMRGPIEMKCAGYPSGGESMDVRARGKGVKASDVTKSRTWENQTYTQVVQQVAVENGFSSSTLFIDHDYETIPEITQTSETDLEFVYRIADRLDREFWIDEYGWHFEIPDKDTRPVTTIKKATHAMGPGVIQSYRVLKVTPNVPRKLTLRARDPLLRKTVSKTVEIDDPGLPVLSGEPVASPTDPTTYVLPADSITEKSVTNEAIGKMRKIKLGAVKMELEVYGDPRIVRNKRVLMTGLHETLDGLWHVHESKHDLGDGYTTTLTIGREGYKRRRSVKPPADATTNLDKRQWGKYDRPTGLNHYQSGS